MSISYKGFAAADFFLQDEFKFAARGLKAKIAEAAGNHAELPDALIAHLESGRLGPVEGFTSPWPSYADDSDAPFARPSHAGNKQDDSDAGGRGNGRGPNKDKNTGDDGTDSSDGGTSGGDGTSDGGTSGGDGTDGGTSDGGTPDGDKTYSADYVSGLDTPSGFNIEITFTGAWTDALMNAVKSAAEQISDFITGDLPDYNGVDDFRLDARLTTIDGAGGYAGRATYSGLRPDSYLPYSGYIKMDEADADKMLGYGIFEELVLHETLHAMGMGTVWKSMGLVQTIGGEPRFTGENAIEAYKLTFPASADADAYADQGVPLTVDGFHWDEAIGKEAMTPRVGERDDVSDLTLAALEDMGYETIYGDDALIA